MPTLRLLIKGKVQGVFYRASAKDVADKLGLSGWIKNTPEGNVEALVNGTEEKVQQFAKWCKRGPSRAKVTEVVISNVTKEEALDGFYVLR